MNLSVALIVLSTLAVPFRTAGQTTEPDQTPPTGSPTSVPPQAPSPASPPVPTAERPVSWKLLLPNLISDQGFVIRHSSWARFRRGTHPPLVLPLRYPFQHAQRDPFDTARQDVVLIARPQAGTDGEHQRFREWSSQNGVRHQIVDSQSTPLAECA